jgi:feruloyl esterase
MRTVTKAMAILLATTTATASFGASSGPSGAAQSPDPDFAARCAALSVQDLGDARITEVTFHAQGRTLPTNPGGPATTTAPHCLVEGTINQRTGAGGVSYGIGFELALPVDWNGRYLLQGGGGLNGSIRPAIGPVAAGQNNALARGFAVASHDSGHKGAGFDASFHADQRAALDFAETSVRTVTLATRAITGHFYGTAPHHSYMTGCSTGGREGMLASQRYPELFDGIVVGAPAMRPGHSNLSAEYAQVLLNATVPEGQSLPAGFTAAERALVDSELARQCDGADGRSDGIIANVEACRSFDPTALSCSASSREGCLSPARAQAPAQAFAGPRYASGRPTYVPFPWDTGITFQGPGLPGFLPSGAPGPFGPASAARTMDVDARMATVEWDAVGRLTDTAYWTNLSTWLGRGAKIIFFHGVSDPWFSAYDTWDYFQRARATNGAQVWDNAARFYMVPGMMHCQGGNAYESFDLLGPLVGWTEGGAAPASITASRSRGASRDMPPQMPLCPHPSYAHYDGGDPNVAGSYSCRVGAES